MSWWAKSKRWRITASGTDCHGKCIGTSSIERCGWYFHCLKASMAACCSNEGRKRPSWSRVRWHRQCVDEDVARNMLALGKRRIYRGTEKISFACLASSQWEAVLRCRRLMLLPASPALMLVRWTRLCIVV